MTLEIPLPSLPRRTGRLIPAMLLAWLGIYLLLMAQGGWQWKQSGFLDFGAPGFTASAGLSTGLSGSMSIDTASAASLACATVSATTQAIGSPTKRTLSAARAGRGV